LEKEANTIVPKTYSKTVTGYELTASNKTIYRYLTTVLDKLTYFPLAEGSTEDPASD